MRSGFFFAMLLPIGAIAQFSGGGGRGDVASLYAPPPAASTLFSGGVGRGEVASLYATTPVASNIITGGNGRGEVAALYASTPVPSNIFSGGNGRGDVASLFVPAPIASNIFGGGNGRGDVASLYAATPIASNIFSGGNGRGDVASPFTMQQQSYLLVALRGTLEGAYNSGTGLMSDALRATGLLPISEPYTVLGYAHAGGGGSETIAPSVLTTTGNDAIVDWVVVELRDTIVASTVLNSRSALIQRDGDIVAMDGVSPLTFSRAPAKYYVALRHRNHLGVMTQSAVQLGLSTMPLDMSSASTATYGTAGRKSITGTFPAQALWAGDVTFNGQIKYTGSGNDRDPILTTVGSTTPNNSVSLYSTRDVNLDGLVKYTGSGNDRDPILVNVGSTTPNNIRAAQLP